MNIITIQDDSRGMRARIAPQFGFNLFELTLSMDDGGGRHGDWNLLWAADRFADGGQRPSGSGIPILFPFPGRLQGGLFHWNNQTWNLPENDGRGNAIHGFVLDRAWRIVDQSRHSVTGTFHAHRDEPQLAKLWPSDFRITATYSIAGCTLTALYRFDNPGDLPLPFGFGIHPYFRLPLAPPPSAADSCVVRLPVNSEWELQSLIATGNSSPADPRLVQGIRFGDLALDNVFGGLDFAAGRCRCTVDEPASGRQIWIDFGEDFRELVVYNPPHREALCIEPYTCVPGAAHLRKRDSDLGWRSLPPGCAVEMQVRIGARTQ
ncbi:MAG: aldose 1-epimerase [Planctomycetes bacterium]|nr:aldose 1-epimerase [Planctomycetota bacterium]